MENDIKKIEDFLKDTLKKHRPSLKIVTDTDERFEVHGTVPTMQGRKKVEGIYFASVVPKPKDIRLYFFPIYTHQAEFENLDPQLRKCLKGKSCFHIKKMDANMEIALDNMIQTGINTYKKDGIL